MRPRSMTEMGVRPNNTLAVPKPYNPYGIVAPPKPRTLQGLINGLFPNEGQVYQSANDDRSILTQVQEQMRDDHTDLRLKKVVERHIEKRGIQDFKTSKIVVIERTLKKSSSTVISRPSSRVPVQIRQKQMPVVFDINKSSITQDDTQPQLIKLFGKSIRIIDSDDEDDMLVKELLQDTASGHHKVVSSRDCYEAEKQTKFYKDPSQTARQAQLDEALVYHSLARKQNSVSRGTLQSAEYGKKPLQLRKTMSSDFLVSKRSKVSFMNQTNITQQSPQHPRDSIFTQDECVELLTARAKDNNIVLESEGISRFQKYCRLNCANRKINLQNLMLQEHSMSVLAVIIASNENRFASLTLRENILKDSAISVLASALIKNDSLVHLDVSQCLISPKGFQILFDAIGSSNSITSLQVGNLSNANRNRIGQLGTQALHDLLAKHKLLMFLDMPGLTLGDDNCSVLAKAFQSNKTLISLNLSRNELSCMASLSTYLKDSQLQQLDLSFNSIGDKNITNLAMFVQNSQSLKWLSLQNCKLGFVGAQTLFLKLQSNKVLTQINVSQNDFNNRSLHRLGQYINSSPSLQTIDLTDCQLGEKGVLSISTCLSEAKLTTLLLASNQCGDVAATSVATALIGQPFLKVLNLSNNNITDQAGITFADAFAGNDCLLKLDLSRNCLTTESAELIETSLRQNKRLSQLNLQGNQRIKLAVLEQIQYRISQNKSIQLQSLLPILKQQKKAYNYLKKGEQQKVHSNLTHQEQLKLIEMQHLEEARRLEQKQMDEEQLENEYSESQLNRSNLHLHQVNQRLNRLKADLEQIKQSYLQKLSSKESLIASMRDYQQHAQNDISFITQKILSDRLTHEEQSLPLKIELDFYTFEVLKLSKKIEQQTKQIEEQKQRLA